MITAEDTVLADMSGVRSKGRPGSSITNRTIECVNPPQNGMLFATHCFSCACASVTVYMCMSCESLRKRMCYCNMDYTEKGQILSH